MTKHQVTLLERFKNSGGRISIYDLGIGERRSATALSKNGVIECVGDAYELVKTNPEIVTPVTPLAKEFARVAGTNAKKALNKCGCGCGQDAKRTFKQGHDMRFKGILIKLRHKELSLSQLKPETASLVRSHAAGHFDA